MTSRIVAFLTAASLLSAGPAFAEDQGAATPVSPGPATVPAHLNAGFGNESFFLRSDDDNFILIPSGRFQYDFYAFQGGSKQPFDTFNVKRARIELFGTFMKHWDYQLGSEFASTTAPIATDVYVNANYTNYANVQLGQFDAPFMMENRTSDKWIDLQERSVLARAFGIPENKEIGGMVWGQPDGKWAYWSLGAFNGEGMNQSRRYSGFDVMGRAWFAPLGLAGIESLKNVWVGGSFWEGNRNPSVANQLDRPAMKTQSGFTFFSPVSGTLHTGYFGQTTKWGLELNAPIGPVVVKAEYVSMSEGLREVSAGAAVRNATLSGSGFYARASYFFWGDTLINGLAGMQIPPRLFGALKPGKTQDALQLVLEYDRLGFTYTPGDGSTTDPFAGNYGFTSYAVGLNYWYTKHVRLTGNFLYYVYDGSTLHPLATAPTSYELTFRVAIAL